MKLVVAIAFLFFANNLNAQQYGYLGKKNWVTFASTGNFRFLPGIAVAPFWDNEGGYSVVKYDENNVRSESYKFFRYDLRASFHRLIQRNTSIGFEGSFEKVRLTRQTTDLSFSTPVVYSYGGAIVIGFHNPTTIAPLKFSNSFGIGPRFYRFARNENYRFNSGDDMDIVYPDYKKEITGINIFWEGSVKSMIARFVMLEFAVRCHTGFVFENGRELKDGTIQFDNQNNTPQYIMSYEFIADELNNTPTWTKNDIHESLANEALLNLLSLKLGVSFIF